MVGCVLVLLQGVWVGIDGGLAVNVRFEARGGDGSNEKGEVRVY